MVRRCSVWTRSLVEELLALLRGQGACDLASRQAYEVVEVHNINAAGAVAAGSCQAVSVGAPGHVVHRRGVAGKGERLIRGKAVAGHRPDPHHSVTPELGM